VIAGGGAGCLAVGGLSVRVVALVEAEGFDTVLRSVGDPYFVALERALGLLRASGRKSSVAAPSVSALAISFPSGCIFMRMVSLRRMRVSAELPGAASGTDSATLLPVVTALVRVPLAARNVEVQVQAISSGRGAARRRGRDQLRMIGAFNVANDHVFAKVQSQMIRGESTVRPSLSCTPRPDCESTRLMSLCSISTVDMPASIFRSSRESLDHCISRTFDSRSR